MPKQRPSSLPHSYTGSTRFTNAILAASICVVAAVMGSIIWDLTVRDQVFTARGWLCNIRSTKRFFWGVDTALTKIVSYVLRRRPAGLLVRALFFFYNSHEYRATMAYLLSVSKTHSSHFHGACYSGMHSQCHSTYQYSQRDRTELYYLRPHGRKKSYRDFSSLGK